MSLISSIIGFPPEQGVSSQTETVLPWVLGVGHDAALVLLVALAEEVVGDGVEEVDLFVAVLVFSVVDLLAEVVVEARLEDADFFVLVLVACFLDLLAEDAFDASFEEAFACVLVAVFLIEDLLAEASVEAGLEIVVARVIMVVLKTGDFLEEAVPVATCEEFDDDRVALWDRTEVAVASPAEVL